MVPPTALASDHFLPQNLSSRKTPTKKICQGYFNRSQNHLENGEVRSKNPTWQQAFNSKIYPKVKSCFRESEFPLILAAERFLEHFIFCTQLPVLLMFLKLDSQRGIFISIFLTEPKLFVVSLTKCGESFKERNLGNARVSVQSTSSLKGACGSELLRTK